MNQQSKPPPTEEQRQRFIESVDALRRTGKALFGGMPVFPLLVYMAAIEGGSRDLENLNRVLKKYIIDTCEEKGV